MKFRYSVKHRKLAMIPINTHTLLNNHKAPMPINDGPLIKQIILKGLSLLSSCSRKLMQCIFKATTSSSIQCYSVLSDILVEKELCIPLEKGSNVLPTGESFICLSPPSKLKITVLFCSI